MQILKCVYLDPYANESSVITLLIALSVMQLNMVRAKGLFTTCAVNISRQSMILNQMPPDLQLSNIITYSSCQH